jgi:hypothetical protein
MQPSLVLLTAFLATIIFGGTCAYFGVQRGFDPIAIAFVIATNFAFLWWGLTRLVLRKPRLGGRIRRAIWLATAMKALGALGPCLFIDVAFGAGVVELVGHVDPTLGPPPSDFARTLLIGTAQACFMWAQFAILVVLSFLCVRAPQGETGLCTNCGYNLTGNESGRCPECGTPTGSSLNP